MCEYTRHDVEPIEKHQVKKRKYAHDIHDSRSLTEIFIIIWSLTRAQAVMFIVRYTGRRSDRYF